ncbi:PEP-CTERM sorting domain-containing protein [Pseudoduganella danionis]|uniref:PEP-CTERM sorting domain-containing protein n=1 Tax=Pseudoduganella danionis TaxID=1890295 RepID=A0ABW9SUV5_9BURK|nr:PEP-CTERM sorting domain-containing protein [Pseudoduganella danionis]
MAAALFGASAAQAAPLFSDNFDTDTLGLNSIAFNGGWSVSGGTVDIIGAPGFFDLVPGNGRYIDLDGSTNKAGIFANSINVVNGMTYALSFDLAGNHRAAGMDTVMVNFGSGSQTYTLADTAGFQTFTLNYTATGTGKVGFSFIDQGADQKGALLDRVTVTAVPEPETYGMLLGGLALLGVVARRRRQG